MTEKVLRQLDEIPFHFLKIESVERILKSHLSDLYKNYSEISASLHSL